METKTIKKLNYKKLIYKKIIVKDVIDKLNEVIEAINKLSKQKIQTKTRFKYPKCPKCKSENTKKGGWRNGLERGKVQRYYCNDCNYHFTPKGFDFRMRVHEIKIKKAFELFNQGYSYAQIAHKIKGVSRQTIGKWLDKYNIQKPKERIIEHEQRNQFGKFKRKYLVKYKQK